MAFISGTKLGPYQIQALIGAGGMGEVYRARDTRLDRSVAIKVLATSLANDPERLRRFEQEARAVAALNHPNILAIHDIGTQDGTSYLVSEFLEGTTLRIQLANGALPARKAIEYALQIAEGLGAAHDRGMVHPAVDRTIRHCLEKDPLERFQSTRDLKFQLEMAAEGLYSGTETARAYGSPFRRRWLMALLIALSLIALSLPLLLARLSAKREPPAYKRLTFRSGAVGTARFSSDGRTVVYGAAWEDNPSEIFVSRVDSSDARPLGIGSSELLAVSKNGELAVLLKPTWQFYVWHASGTLATVPLEGGTPREIAEHVTAADW